VSMSGSLYLQWLAVVTSFIVTSELVGPATALLRDISNHGLGYAILL